MNKTSTYLLRLPKSLNDQMAKVAKRDITSINQFIAIAVAEKVSALETEQFFSDRAKQANMNDFKHFLFRSEGEPPRLGDEL